LGLILDFTFVFLDLQDLCFGDGRLGLEFSFLLDNMMAR
jgi:hypothetical protein